MSILNDFAAKKRYQILNDEQKQLISYWTSADTVECANQNNLSNKLTAIDSAIGTGEAGLMTRIDGVNSELSVLNTDLSATSKEVSLLNSKMDNIVIAKVIQTTLRGTTERQTGYSSLTQPPGYTLMSTKFSSYSYAFTAEISTYNAEAGLLHYHYISTAPIETTLIITAFFIKNKFLSTLS